jgi:hypothetical protein
MFVWEVITPPIRRTRLQKGLHFEDFNLIKYYAHSAGGQSIISGVGGVSKMRPIITVADLQGRGLLSICEYEEAGQFFLLLKQMDLTITDQGRLSGTYFDLFVLELVFYPTGTLTFIPPT